MKRLRRWRARPYRADGWAAYAKLLPVGQLQVGKDQKHGIERDHTRRRHWLARFRRRSIAVSKTECMVDASIARFARSDKIHDLSSMRAQNPAGSFAFKLTAGRRHPSHRRTRRDRWPLARRAGPVRSAWCSGSIRVADA